MHFHLPKPLHGWREFAGEVGIIVIGVLIALAAEQVVEDFHWRHTIALERKALDSDVQGIWGAMSARAVIQPCVDRRLSDLALVLARHDHGQPLGIVGLIGRPGVWTASSNALRMATADGTLTHMSLSDKTAYFDVDNSYQTFAPIADEERASWRVLEGLNEPAVLGAEDWRELRKAYRDAVDSNRVLKFNLVVGAEGQWLTPFKRFRRYPDNKAALEIPMVKDLCSYAVSQ